MATTAPGSRGRRPGVWRRRRVPFKNIRQFLVPALLEIGLDMLDGSYWAPAPNDLDFEHPQQSAGSGEAA